MPEMGSSSRIRMVSPMRLRAGQGGTGKSRDCDFRYRPENTLRTGQGGDRNRGSEQRLRARFTRRKNRKRETEEGEGSG